MAAPQQHRLPQMGPPVAAADPSTSSAQMFPGLASVSVPRGGDAVVKYRTAANRSRLPEPLRLFAYILEADSTELQWYDEAYGVITTAGLESRLPQTWFGLTDFIRTVNLIAALDQLESHDPAGTRTSLSQNIPSEC